MSNGVTTSTKTLEPIFVSLRAAQRALSVVSAAERDKALLAVADALSQERGAILAANAVDEGAARERGVKEALLERLRLDDKKIDGICASINKVAALPSPIGRVIAGWTMGNGLFVEQVTVPLGVASIIYESRPDVTTDAFAIAYKSGCAVLLRGSSSAKNTNDALLSIIKRALTAAGGIKDAVELAPSVSHDEVAEIIAARSFIDVVIPRGGRSLIQNVVQNARVPVIETGEGNCHIYVEPSFDVKAAVDIIVNAKLQRPGACNACETLLVHKDAAPALLPALAAAMAGKAELRVDQFCKNALGSPPARLTLRDAVDADFETEFLDTILAVKMVDNVDEAVSHINKYGTGHSEAILTRDLDSANKFLSEVDAACVYLNASTRFTDGGQFGFGCELGISTQKFHVRGPMGLSALTTTKYILRGDGQARE